MTSPFSVHRHGSAIAVGGAGMVLAWLSGEASGLLAVLPAVYICSDRCSRMSSIGICGLSLGLFFLLPQVDLPPDIRVCLRFAALVTAVIAICMLIQDKKRATAIDQVKPQARLERTPGLGSSTDATGVVDASPIDMNERKEAGEAARRREVQFRQLIDAIPALVWCTTPEGEPCYFNRRLIDYTGMTLGSFDDSEGRTWKALAMQALVHPDDLAEQERLCSHSFQAGDPIRSRYRLRRADGAYRWVDARVDPLRDDDGRIVQWYGVCVDVDDSQKAEQALRDNERQLGLLIDTIPALVWCCTPAGVPSYLNKRMVDYTGMTLNSADLLADESRPSPTMKVIYHPDEIDELRRHWFHCVRTGETFNMRYRLRRADGVYRWVDARAEPLRDSDGRIVHWYGVNVDVDERERAEEALRATEADLRSILDNVPGMIATADSHGRLDYANKRDLDYFRVEMSDLTGHSFIDVIHPEEREATMTAWLHAVQTGEPTDFHHRFRRHDGVYRWFHSRVEPTIDRHGKVVRWYGLFTDVDERQHAEEALRSTERQLRLLIDAIPALVWCATPNGEPSYLNKRMIDFTGIALNSFENSQGGSPGSLARRAIVHPDELAELERFWSHSVQTGATLRMRHRLRRVDGVYRWVELRAEPLRNDDGDIVQWYGVFVDIEDETRMQDQLRAAQAKLSRASQAASLAELSASIAHEVNQPLAAVIANSHACQRWLSTEPPNLQRARVTVERIIRDANGTADVVSRIRALFKQNVSTRDAVNLNEVITEVCKLIGDDVARKNITIEVDLEPNLPSALVDRVQMQQVLVNLTRNGIDAMESSTESPRSLLIRSRRDGMSEIMIEVRDRGSGVEDIERIFEPFFTTKKNGMGMGLAICRSIIEAHDGQLRATPNEPRGTRLTFTLPAHPSEPQ
jgi:PAS domain S-box-containing protein